MRYLLGRLGVALALLSALVLGACSGGDSPMGEEGAAESNATAAEPIEEANNPRPGQYRGTTSQGMEINLWVEDVSGQLMVTKVQYKIQMEAESFTATTELSIPSARSMTIENGRFSGTDSGSNSTEVFNGKFAGDQVEGELICTNTHPQGLGTATGEVSFSAKWMEP